jgi:toxin ParE1/3/4
MHHDFHPEALEEFRNAISWYADRSWKAPENFAGEVRTAIRTIERDPMRFEPVGRNIRVFRLHQFPYHLYYEMRQDMIYILAVAHTKRRPDYWRGRAK